ncbi:MAG TPA: phage tail tip lysozyme [Caulobacteraceae bacterium]|nr:phage tail tip lysozyme [Caulobacteraceae bacterium]
MADPTAQAASLQDWLNRLAMQFGGVTTLPDIQHSQYLAEALQQMSQQGQNIRTPVALGSDLLAEALERFGLNKANAKLAGLIGQGQTRLLGQGDDLLPGSQTGQAGGAPASGASAQTPPGSPDSGTSDLANALATAKGGAGFAGNAPASGAAPSQAVPPQGNAPLAAALGASPPSTDPRAHMLADLVGGGLSPIAASGLVGNFTQESGPNLTLDNPSEGAIGAANWRGGRAQALQAYEAAHGGPSIDNQAAFILSELHGPEGATLARLNAATDPTSAADAAMGYERPRGWTPGGSPQAVSGWQNREGAANSVYSSFGQSNGPGPQVGSSAGQTSPAPRPFQISTGADPSIGSPSAFGPATASPSPVSVPPQGGTNGHLGPAASGAGASMLPGLAAGVGAGAAAMQNAYGGPRQGQTQVGTGVTPAPIQPWQQNELLRLHGLAQQNYPMYGQQFQDYLAGLRKQQSTPEDVDISRPTSSGQVFLTGKQTGRVWIRSPDGAIVETGARAATSGGQPQGAPIGGGPLGTPPQAAGPQGQGGPSYQPIADTQPHPLTDPQARAAYGISPSDQNAYAVDASGKLVKTADAPFNLQGAMGLVGDLTKSEQYTKASHATDMYRSAINAAGRPGGIPDAELVDFAAQEMSGGVARQFNQKMIAEGQGPWAQLQQFAPQLISGQKLSPQARQALLQSMSDYATEAQGTFGALAKSSAAMAGAGGYDITPFIGPLMRPLPPVPGAAGIPNGMPGGAPPGTPAGGGQSWYGTPAGGGGMPQAVGPGSHGWPAPNGKPVDPDSPAGQLARRFIAAGHVWDPRTGDWQ